MCAVEVAPNKCFCVEFLQVRTGGKGSVRRKKKAVHKTAGTDDKRLQNTLKRLGINSIPAIEEVPCVERWCTVLTTTFRRR